MTLDMTHSYIKIVFNLKISFVYLVYFVSFFNLK